MPNQKKKTKTKTSGILLKLALLAVCVFLLYSNISLLNDLSQKQRDYNAVQKQVQEVSLSVQQKLDLLKNGTQKDFIEKAARDKLDYAYANEVIYKDSSGK